jgi:hypothetical protein
MTAFATVTAVGMIAGIAMGGNVVTSVGLWIALVASFALGQVVGIEQREERRAKATRGQ